LNFLSSLPSDVKTTEGSDCCSRLLRRFRIINKKAKEGVNDQDFRGSDPKNFCWRLLRHFAGLNFFLLTFYLIFSIPRERAKRLWRSHLSAARDQTRQRRGWARPKINALFSIRNKGCSLTF